MKKILFLTTILFTVFSCREAEIVTFPDEKVSSIYIQFDGSYNMDFSTGIASNRNFLDSIVYSLANQKADVKYVIRNFPIKIMGNVKDYDRKVNFKIHEELTTAKLGEDFEIELDTTYVKAGANRTNIRVKLYRTPNNQKQRVRVAIQLLENEHFDFSMAQFKGNENPSYVSPTYNAQVGKIIFSDIMIESFYYEVLAVRFFGVFSVEKSTILNSIMDWTPEDWRTGGDLGSQVQYSKFGYAAYALRDELQARADSGKPEREADGSFIQLADKYAVDYSAYQ